MQIKNRFLLFGTSLSGLVLCLLTACNSQPQGIDADADTDHYHEKSFSWDDASWRAVLAKTAERQTRFNTAEDLYQATATLDEELRVPGASDSLWKPIDYACDELALGLWNKYGTVLVGDSVVLDEKIVKSGCHYIGDDSTLAKKSSLSKSADDFTGAVVNDRQYPYKMIGESWDVGTFSAFGYTGALTQFKKHRERFGITGWYDTDASRIGVRTYLLKCSYTYPKRCLLGTSPSDWNKNDDYVSSRVFAANEKPVLETIPTGNYPPTERVYVLKNQAVIAMHSVDHAGLQFRASSSAGMGSSDYIVGPLNTSYVTW